MATVLQQITPRPNVGSVERLASLVTGGLLAAGGLNARDPICQALALGFGGALLLRGATGYCGMYAAAGLDTANEEGPATAVRAGHGFKFEESITIARPASELYAFWRNFEQLPRFMNHLKKVTSVGGNRTHWVAEGPMGVYAEWDAEVINDRPNELIAWKSVEGSRVDTAGSVHFVPTRNGHGTEVRVSLKYDPPGGKTGARLAWLAGYDAETMVREDLERFRQLMETSHTAPTRAPALAAAGK